ncbi:DUF6086 family protein, partial [Streptomyces sp. NPDC005485]|uniref:DUF6086 family protein n=1 Tax=Streptomyces sp. NPDC005485 TaxID=3155591 RepID=UPI0033B8529D
MSQYYDLGDRTLWNPSNGASRLFLRQVAVHEAELGMSSGIGPMENDESFLDAAAFAAFADALLARHRATTHGVVIALSEGFVATVLVLAERADIEVRWPTSDPAASPARRDVQVPAPPAPDADAWTAALREKARELGR